MLREFSLPRLDTGPQIGGLADAVFENADAVPHFVQLERKTCGRWRQVTAARFRNEVIALAKGLLAEGIRSGDSVGILARTCYEWTLFDYALWTIGAQPVPLYPTSSPEQARHILDETEAVACVVEHGEQLMTLGLVIDQLPALTRIWELDTGVVQRLSEAGRNVPDEVLHRHRLAVTPETVASVVYTSGTTGRPKGCIITHGNLMTQVDNMLHHCGPLLSDQHDGGPASTLLFLPLAHIFGRTVQVAAFRGRVRLAHQPSMSTADVFPDLATFRPTSILAVPYVFEKVFHVAQRRVEAAGHGALFDRAVEVAVTYAEARERQAFEGGAGPSPALRMKHRRYNRLVYPWVRGVFGGRLVSAISGGSALSRRLGLFFAGAGVTIHEGYGLTESCSGVTCNPPYRVKFGTVGRAVHDLAVRIADDGEILLRGPQLFTGYLKDVEASAKVLRDGWLATGDLGSLDDEGYLTITGRKKDIIVTSGGTSVSPMMLEDRVRTHPLIAQCVVVGDNRPFVAALITLDPDALPHWLARQGKPPEPPEKLVRASELEAEIRRAVAAANAVVSRAESIRAYRILPTLFTHEQGLLTPSLKLRRREVVQAYAAEIEELYSGQRALGQPWAAGGRAERRARAGGGTRSTTSKR